MGCFKRIKGKEFKFFPPFEYLLNPTKYGIIKYNDDDFVEIYYRLGNIYTYDDIFNKSI